MPNRILKESICTSDSIDSLSAFQETLFYRLIVNCDDYGRFDGRPKVIASKCFPLKDIRASQIEDALRTLTSAELVILYEVGGKPFLQMKTWDRHQQIRAKKPKYPGPAEAEFTSASGYMRTNESDINCNQMLSDDGICSRNPIQSESESESESEVGVEPSSPPAAALTLVDGSKYIITEADAEADAKAFPAVDVRTEYLRMERWLQANPANRKTRRGIRRFVTNWLGRTQDSARSSSKEKPGKTVAAQQYHQREYEDDDSYVISDWMKKRLAEGDRDNSRQEVTNHADS